MDIHKHSPSTTFIASVLMVLVLIGQISPAGATQSRPEQTSVQYLGDITNQLKLQQIQLTGKGTQGLAIDQDTGLVYTAAFSGINNKCLAGDTNSSASESFLNIVDPARSKEIVAVPTDRAPIWPTVDARRDVVYVAASSGSVAIHNRGTGEKTGSINVGGLPHQSAFLGNVMVVSNTYDQSQTYYSVINLDSRTVTANPKGPRLPHPIAIDEEAKLAYMMGVEAAEVTTIDMDTGQPKETFKLEGGGGQMTFSKKLQKFVTDSSEPGTSAAVFDFVTRKPLGTLGFQGANSPGSGLAIDDESGLLFVVISDLNAVGVASLKTLKPLGFFKVGGCPYGVRIDGQRKKGYVTNSGDRMLTVFNLKELSSVVLPTTTINRAPKKQNCSKKKTKLPKKSKVCQKRK